MSDLLTTLAGRALGQGPALRPRPVDPFAPVAGDDPGARNPGHDRRLPRVGVGPEIETAEDAFESEAGPASSQPGPGPGPGRSPATPATGMWAPSATPPQADHRAYPASPVDRGERSDDLSRRPSPRPPRRLELPGESQRPAPPTVAVPRADDVAAAPPSWLPDRPRPTSILTARPESAAPHPTLAAPATGPRRALDAPHAWTGPASSAAEDPAFAEARRSWVLEPTGPSSAPRHQPRPSATITPSARAAAPLRPGRADAPQQPARVETRTPAVTASTTPVEPIIHVTIGRVEVRAVPAPPSASSGRSRPAQARIVGLDEYLRGPAGGRGGRP